MCVQYWPARAGITDTYPTIKVELLKEEQLSNFMIRTFKLYKTGQVFQIVFKVKVCFRLTVSSGATQTRSVSCNQRSCIV